MISLPTFSDFWSALWGYKPFPWQDMLAERLLEGEWPRVLDLPSATGKTACIDIAIYALAAQADKPVWERTAPRRIWFVVDRRIVVDQAFERARTIAKELYTAKDGPLKVVADRLFEVGGTKERPLATGRLRGGVLRDDGWARLPSQPAVITSTVDQLGSRLLFRGYGRSSSAAPIFAGLAAHDSLIVLDEAHLSVPFLETLRAVERYRSEDWAEEPIRTPFAFTMLSATPPADVPTSECFPGIKRDEALDDPTLHERLTASKPAELIEVKDRSGEQDPLVEKAVRRACDFTLESGHRRVAVVVNRVATAQAVASAIWDAVGENANIALLTGRLRPLDRDELLERWQPVLRAGHPDEPEKPVILVATQTIEVGADFSFDAMVTEAASLDALRQRFGRLNRLGAPRPAPAAVLIRAADTKADNIDPVYGRSMADCWELLEQLAETRGEGKRETRIVDFGVDGLDARLAEVEELQPYLAPVSRAPMLLPAHLDLLCQTAPQPPVQPDIQLYLHGMDRGMPEVRVVWRADLDPKHLDRWPETVGLCPPNSTEALSVPLHRLRRWLSEPGSVDEDADVEGASGPREAVMRNRISPALIWHGRERSWVCTQSTRLKPNDLIVVPAAYGMAGLGQAVADEGSIDIWERSHCRSGRRPALRLHRGVLESWLGCPPLDELVSLAASQEWDDEALQAAIDNVLEYTPDTDEDAQSLPDWLRELLRICRHAKTEEHPDRGLVLFARHAGTNIEGEQDVFADDDDLLSASGRQVSLAGHSASVERAVVQLGSRCLPDSFLELLKYAAYWHDTGKLDERFQLLLYQGDWLGMISGEPLAKSEEIPASQSRRRWLRHESGLPVGFRHEMLSCQLAERYAQSPEVDVRGELILHAVASHHGHARPFAPVTPDPDPPSIHVQHGCVAVDIDGKTRASWPAPYAIESGVTERFWRLNRRYGWWGLAYLEAILRLGDWYGSEWVLEDAGPDPERAGEGKPVLSSVTEGGALQLSGIDGTNPLGFLAALGTLVALHALGHHEVRLAWRRGVTWQPVLSGLPTDDRSELATLLAEGLQGTEVSESAEEARKGAEKRYDKATKAAKDKQKEIKQRGLRGTERQRVIEEELGTLKEVADRSEAEWRAALRRAVPRPELALGKHIDCTAAEFRDQATSLLASAERGSRESLDLLAAFASDSCLHDNDDKRKKGVVAATPFCFITGSGHQYFLDFVRQLLEKVEPDRVRSTLFEPWTYDDPGLSMRWDPAESRRYALMDKDPGPIGSLTVWIANLLAYRALMLFPSAPRGNGLATVGWATLNGEACFTWPLWEHPCSPDTIHSLLVLSELYLEHPDRAALRERGISAVFRSRRVKVGTGANYKLNFSPPRSP